MGIAPYKSFTFDGESSLNYGVYLTGEGVFNAPVRAVEMIEIPGRNGNFALDQGRFENITVTYRAGMFDVNESNFADKVSAARNWLCSKVGYCRLEDEYNPNEYRMAVYSNGLELDHDMLIAGEFDITFDCKPQRFLTSGETATTVTSGATVTNPTLFESSPKLEVKGYGTIGFNNYSITLNNDTFGYIVLANDVPSERGYTLPSYMANNGDTLIGGKVLMSGQAYDKNGNTISSIVDASSGVYMSGETIYINFTFSSNTFTVGTTSFGTRTVYFTAVTPNDERQKLTMQFRYRYDSGTGKVTCSLYSTSNSSVSGYSPGTLDLTGRAGGNISNIAVNSTASILGNPTYIDCEIGEVYKIQSSDIISLNAYADLGSDLPKLASGSNTVTFNNTFTEVKLAPRWWKV